MTQALVCAPGAAVAGRADALHAPQRGRQRPLRAQLAAARRAQRVLRQALHLRARSDFRLLL